MSNLTSITLSSGNVTNTGTFSTLDNTFGTAGTSNSNVASVQGISGGTPLTVTGPITVSGTSNVALTGTGNVAVVNTATVTVASITGTSNVSVVNGITTVAVSGTSNVAVTGTANVAVVSVVTTPITVGTVTITGIVAVSGSTQIVTVSSAIPGTSNVSVVNGITTVSLSGTSNVNVVNSVTVSGTVTTSAPTASDFLWGAGYTGNNGLVGTTLTVITGEIISLTASGVTVSATGGATGVFYNSSTGTNQAIWGDVYFSNGAPGVTSTSAGVNIAGWWLQSLDGGTTFESASTSGSTQPPRPPDWIIPLPASVSTTVYKSIGLTRIPSTPFKVLVQNNYAATLGSGATTAPYIKITQYGVQH